MSGRLIYVVGPSGAGKDSVIEYARMQLPLDSKVIFSRRFITRTPTPSGEQHIPISVSMYESLLLNGGFALSWSANGIKYGIGNEVKTWLKFGFNVVVNGSREYLLCAANYYPSLLAVHITAPIEVIEKRLEKRGREDSHEVAARLKRAAELSPPCQVGAFTIVNDKSLEVAGNQLTNFLLSINEVVVS